MSTLLRLPALALLAAGVAAQGIDPSQRAFPGTPLIAPDGGCGLPPTPRGSAQPARPPCPVGRVLVPEGWYSGDTHEHTQLCLTSELRTVEEVRGEYLARGENVANLLVWGVRINAEIYHTSFQHLITGVEDPSTIGYPEQVIQYGIETSGFRCSRLGHSIGLNIDPAQADFFTLGGCPTDDQSGDFSAPVFDFFHQGRQAVVGYAHQTWPVELYAPSGQGGFDWEEPSLPAFLGADSLCSSGHDLAFPDITTTIIHPTLLPFDVATGRVDFLEAAELYVDLSTTPSFQDRWFGMVYKLLSAGQEVAISGGTDADCVSIHPTTCEPRTWVKLEEGAAFGYDAWTAGLAAGRSSVSDGGHQFLELSVAGQDPGSYFYVASSEGVALVPLVARFRLAPGVRHPGDAIEIVQDGEVVHSAPFGPQRGGMAEVAIDVPFTKSGWLSARTASGGTHTGFVYVIVDGEPIASCPEADYLTIYADYLNWLFDWAATLPDPAVLAAWVGCSEAEVRAHIADGREVFAAVRDYAAGPPQGARRLGWSTPTDHGPVGITVNVEPRASSTCTVRCFRAPPDAFGALILSPWYDEQPESLLGASLFVLGSAQGVPTLAFPARSKPSGFAQRTLNLPPALAGYDLYAQWVWRNPKGYDGLSTFSASEALELRIR